jgi:hypothetical protein
VGYIECDIESRRGDSVGVVRAELAYEVICQG